MSRGPEALGGVTGHWEDIEEGGWGAEGVCRAYVCDLPFPGPWLFGRTVETRRFGVLYRELHWLDLKINNFSNFLPGDSFMA